MSRRYQYTKSRTGIAEIKGDMNMISMLKENTKTRVSRLILLGFVLSFSVACNKKYDEVKLTWSGPIQGWDKEWEFTCDRYGDIFDLQCYDCRATLPHGGTITVPKYKQYKVIYERCENMPVSPPKFEDTEITNSPLGGVSFSPYTSQEYGFDQRSYNLIQNDDDGYNYLSIAAGGSTKFVINISDKIAGLYSSRRVVIPNSDASKLTFPGGQTMQPLSVGANTITINAASDAPVNSTWDLYVYGIEDNADPACLAGLCDKYSEDVLKIVVYEKRIFNDYKIYEHTSYYAADTTIRAEYNKILKQAVLELGTLDRVEVDEDDWDLNGNKKLDVFPGYDPMNDIIKPDSIFYDEFNAYFLEAEGGFMDCYNNEAGATYLSPYPIIPNWVLAEDPVPQSDGKVKFLKVDKLDGLDALEGVDAKIGRFDGTGTHTEITIWGIDPGTGEVIVSMRGNASEGIPNIYKAADDISIYKIKGYGGQTVKSCALVSTSGTDWNTHVHEFLHQGVVGILEDLSDTKNKNRENIMYNNSQFRTDNKLSYRSMETIHSDSNDKPIYQKQWDSLHPDCDQKDECKLINDCCHCIVATQDAPVPACDVSACGRKVCDRMGISSGNLGCAQRRCTLEGVNGECDEKAATCAAEKPDCPPGYLSSVKNRCWSACIPEASCTTK